MVLKKDDAQQLSNIITEEINITESNIITETALAAPRPLPGAPEDINSIIFSVISTKTKTFNFFLWKPFVHSFCYLFSIVRSLKRNNFKTCRFHSYI